MKLGYKKRSKITIKNSNIMKDLFYTGGLVAVHSAGRDRESIWQALERREVYGTSGERILLWFDLDRDGQERMPMGSQIDLTGVPRFHVRAVGAFRQRPGCPPHSVDALTPDQQARYLRLVGSRPAF